ncbi:MAG: phage shock protein PspA, partial [Candidatus Hydrogenedentota bacterium]
MGIFSRMSDIISSNINSMLDKAEDPEKLVKMMIREMEDTLVEVKASCAGAMATKKRVQRELNTANERAREWADKAQLAVDKEREDLAREALMEKKRYTEKIESLKKELEQCDALVNQYQSDIQKLEDKLSSARERQRVLVQRHIHAKGKKRAEEGIRKVDTSDAMVRFERFENRIERMEAEADLVNMGRKPNLEEEFSRLKTDDSIDKELQELKNRRQQQTGGGSQ